MIDKQQLLQDIGQLWLQPFLPFVTFIYCVCIILTIWSIFSFLFCFVIYSFIFMATNLTWVQNRKSLKIWLEKNSTFIILERHQIKQKKREKLSFKITKKMAILEEQHWIIYLFMEKKGAWSDLKAKNIHALNYSFEYLSAPK